MSRLFLLSILLFVPVFAGAAECRYQAERNLDIDQAGLKTLALQTGSSDLVVHGVPGLARIEVRGKACASDQALLADLRVGQTRAGDRVVVSTQTGQTGITISLSGLRYAYIDLDVRMPANLPLEVHSDSGDSDITGVAALDYHAGSGDLKLSRVAGAVGVTIDSGDVEADGIGSLDLRSAGSGDLHVRNVQGDVHVGSVDSGDLGFADVKGALEVESIGSGDIAADRIGRDVRIGHSGSGDISVDGVGGDFVVTAKHDADAIRYRDVSGKVDVPKSRDD